MPEQFYGDTQPWTEETPSQMAGVVDSPTADSPQWQRLRNSMDWSRRRLIPFIDHRFEFLRQYVGFRYSNDGLFDKNPVNLMEMSVNVYVRALAANQPKALVTTPHFQLKPTAFELELAVNRLMHEIQFGRTLHRVVRDALFSIGIIKTGISFGGSVEVMGEYHDVGQPFADVVDLDDWVHDMGARNWEECTYMGNRYRLPTDWVKSSPMFNQELTQQLGTAYRSNYNEFGTIKSDTIGRGVEGDRDEFMDMSELWDVWVPQDQLVVTFMADSEGSPTGPPIRVVEWNGPEGGPYSILTFNEVPNNCMPVSPAMLWYDLADLYMRLYNKLGRQAERQKTVLGVQAADTGDGERILRAEDGQALRVDNPDRAREYNFGGPSQENLAFSIYTKDLFSWLSGNLDALAGLGPQADTLGQDRLLAQEASKRMTAMQDRTTTYVTEVVRNLAKYLWYDPFIEIPLTKPLGKSGIEVPATWSEESKEGDFIDYNITIQPYSMSHKSPTLRLQTINMVMQQYVLPMMPYLEQQGITVNFDGLLRTIAKYTDMDELEDVLTFMNDSQMRQMMQKSVSEPRQSPSTHRTHERINRPGATTPGKDYAMMMNLFGGEGPGVQQSQLSAIGRPSG